MTIAEMNSFIAQTIENVDKRLEPSTITHVPGHPECCGCLMCDPPKGCTFEISLPTAPACEQCGSICILYPVGGGNFCLHCATELFG
jgi:hypothetical protein